jgi:hypothetical protein
VTVLDLRLSSVAAMRLLRAARDSSAAEDVREPRRSPERRAEAREARRSLDHAWWRFLLENAAFRGLRDDLPLGRIFPGCRPDGTENQFRDVRG